MSTSAADQRELASSSPERTTGTVVNITCRILDVLVATAALVVLAPVMLVVAAVVRLDSPGPVFFRQRRVGRSLRPFTIYKFRTMTNGASHDVHRAFVLDLIAGAKPAATNGEQRFKLTQDARVTKAGRILRRTSLDELPQLWNVLRGEMSLVGPRPAIPYEVEHYPAHWLRRFDVKPGLTGLWQVSGRSRVALEDMIKLDIAYAERRSLLFNLWILVRTVPAVLTLRGAR